MATSELGRSYGKEASKTSDEEREDLGIAPGRRARSAMLFAPEQPIASGIVPGSAGIGLPAMIQRTFEASLGTDLSSVRVHTGEASARAASAFGARAYAVGQDIHFGAGQYDPTSEAGQHLLAHEVAHTVQQRGGSPVRQNKLAVSSPADGLELEADRMADAMVAGAPATASRASAGAIQRKELRADGAPVAAPAKPKKPGGGKTPKKPATPKTAPVHGKSVAPSPSTGTAANDNKSTTPNTQPPKTDGKTPASGVDWKAFWAGNGPNYLRTGLEVSRLLPGWGLITGLGADLVEHKQNLDSLNAVKDTEAGKNLREVLVVRQLLTMGNNMLGHIRYLLTLVNDGLVGSVVGAPILAITAPAAAVLNSISVGTTSAQMTLDLCIGVGARIEAGKCEGDKAAFAAWHGIEQNFFANAGTGAIGLLLDIADMATDGFANAVVIKQVRNAIKATKWSAKGMQFSLLPLLKNWLGVWGASAWQKVEDLAKPKAPAGPGAASSVGAQVGPHGMQRSVAGNIMLAEIDQIEAAYRVGDVVVQHALGVPARMAADVNTVIKQVSGAKDPFLWIRDKLASGIQENTAKISRMLEIKSGAAQAEKGARTASTALDQVLAAVDQIQMPKVAPAATKLGDNAVAKAAGSVVDGAKGLGASAANAALGKLQGAIDQVREPTKQYATNLKADMSWIIQFTTELQSTLNEQTAKIGELGAMFAEKLSKCRNVEDVFNMLLGLGAKVMGSDDFTVDDLRAVWQEIRAGIDQGFATAREVAGGGAAPGKPAANAATAPAPAAPTPPPAPAPAPAPTKA